MKTILAGLALCWAAPALAQAPMPERAAAPAEQAVDPIRLAAAKRMVDAMLPPGAFRRVMSGYLGGMDSLFDMDMGSLGTEGEGAGTSLGEAASEGDPHFRERMRISNEITIQAMGDLMAEWEPELRNLFARHYAARFTVPQLDEMTTFFSTPTGRQYVEVSMAMAGDPAFMQNMMTSLMPRMMAAFPRIEARIRAATAHLPPAPGTAEPDPDPDEDAGED